jgi:hypothetical protein
MLSMVFAITVTLLCSIPVTLRTEQNESKPQQPCIALPIQPLDIQANRDRRPQ